MDFYSFHIDFNHILLFYNKHTR